MYFKAAFVFALTIFSSTVTRAEDHFIDTDSDCTRATGVRCAVLRERETATLLMWRPEAPDEATRAAWIHERQLIERNFAAEGGKKVIVRETNTRTGQLVEHTCEPSGCDDWHAVVLPESNPIALWEQLSN